MNERDLINILQSDIEIPKLVQKKADQAFAQIRQSGGGTGKIGRKPRRTKKAVVLFVAAAVLALGGVTVLAAYRSWSRSLSEGLQATPEQMTALEEEGAAAFIMESQTQNGVTVTAQQTIVDNYFAHVSFKVEGYELPEGAETCFENINITVDGGTDYNMEGSFYNGLVTGENGMAVYADGSPIDYGAEDGIFRYVQEDGSLEYVITLFNMEKGYFLGKKIHVELENLGTVYKALYSSDYEVAGKWSFDWTLSGTAQMKEYALNEVLGDTGATVVKAEISPISMHVEYCFPYQTYTESGLDGNGNAVEAQFMKEAPPLAGVRLKDGTVYSYLCNGGSEGYDADSLDTYCATYANDRIIDPDEVADLLFRKSVNGVYSEKDFYYVAVE